MSKVKKGQTAPCPEPSAWLTPALPNGNDEGRLAGLIHAIRAAMAAGIKRSPLSRWQLSGKMSELLHRDISKDMLDKYTSDSAEAHRPPADTLAAFCLATNAIDALDVLAEAVGCVLMPIYPGATGDLSGDLRSGLLRITGELGEAATALEESLHDGVLTAKESQRIRRELRDVMQRAAAVSALLARHERA